MKLMTPVNLGRIELKNRVVMAPMTRSRATEDGDMPNTLMQDYYTQRASAGLIITEGTHPSMDGKGYCRTPGLYNDAQQKCWQDICRGVHDRGGKIVLQLMHCGRVGHPHNKAPSSRILCPSSIPAKGEIYTEKGMQNFVTPIAMTLGDIENTINDYVAATGRAYAAGFDGVELHCASGYLPAQFLSTGTNQRVDRYGGSLENRLRFVIELLQAMTAVDGPDRIGMRICPGNPFNDLFDENPVETFSALLKEVSEMRLAYLHVIRMPLVGDNIGLAKASFDGPIIVNDSYDQIEAEQILADRHIAAVSFGRKYISNPDLVERFQNNWPLSDCDFKSLYTPGPHGYTDYKNYSG